MQNYFSDHTRFTQWSKQWGKYLGQLHHIHLLIFFHSFWIFFHRFLDLRSLIISMPPAPHQLTVCLSVTLSCSWPCGGCSLIHPPCSPPRSLWKMFASCSRHPSLAPRTPPFPDPCCAEWSEGRKRLETYVCVCKVYITEIQTERQTEQKCFFLPLHLVLDPHTSSRLHLDSSQGSSTSGHIPAPFTPPSSSNAGTDSVLWPPSNTIYERLRWGKLYTTHVMQQKYWMDRQKCLVCFVLLQRRLSSIFK